MGMRINTGSGIDPHMVEQLIELERHPIKLIEGRKIKVEDEQKKFGELKSLVSSLGVQLNGFKNRSDFYKMVLESSHPDIIDGTVDINASIGSYELEVRNLAKTHKLLAEAYEDKDETSVGFGYMMIELENGDLFDLIVDPEKDTLQDVASQINEANAGVSAMIINTKEDIEHEGEDRYRLLVVSKTSGKQGKIYIDPDTTDLEFGEQVTGRNLCMMFEDVEVYNENNTVDELLPGTILNVKKAEPGTKINIQIDHDIEATKNNIKELVETYNKVNAFLEDQFRLDPQSNRSGILAKDNTLKNIRRGLQQSFQIQLVADGQKFSSLPEIGIITDAKTGALKVDDAKLETALSEDYDSVARLFIYSDDFKGAGARLAEAVKDLQNAQHGVITSKDREYKKTLENFDKDLDRQERLAEQKAQNIKRKFAAVEQVISGMNAQGKVLQQKFGAPSEQS